MAPGQLSTAPTSSPMEVDERLEPALRASAAFTTPLPIGVGAPAPPLSAGADSPVSPTGGSAGGAVRSPRGTPNGAAAPPRLDSPKTQRRLAKHEKKAKGDVSPDTGVDKQRTETCMVLTRSSSNTSSNLAEGAEGGGGGHAPPPAAAAPAASAAGTDAPSQRVLFRRDALPPAASAQPPRRNGTVPLPDPAGLRPPDLPAAAAAAGRRPEPMHHPAAGVAAAAGAGYDPGYAPAAPGVPSGTAVPHPRGPPPLFAGGGAPAAGGRAAPAAAPPAAAPPAAAPPAAAPPAAVPPAAVPPAAAAPPPAVGADVVAAIAAAVAAAAAARGPAHAPRPPKELLWPRVSNVYAPTKSGKGPAEDFADWYRGYSQLARLVPVPFQVQHLMTAVENAVRKNCEGWATERGAEITDLPLHEVCAHIASTFDRPDGEHRRIIKYLQMTMPDRGEFSTYVRMRQEHRHVLALDGVHLPLPVERALLVQSLTPALKESLVKDPGWSQMDLQDLTTTLTAKAKALSVAKGVDRQGAPTAGRGGWQSQPRTGFSRPRSSLNLMAAENNLKRKQADRASSQPEQTLAAMGGGRPDNSISQRDMQQYYSEGDWTRRTARPYPLASDPENARLFNKDRGPDGRPYCLMCRKGGHTLDRCSKVAARAKGKGQSSRRPNERAARFGRKQ